MKDLVVLVPDKDVRFGIDGLLSRYQSLNIRKISYEIFIHPMHDPGVYHDAANFLRPFSNQYSYALAFLDLEGSGQQGSTEEIAEYIKRDIERNGWPEKVEVVVFNPELEIWIWIESQHTAKALGWDDYLELKEWLRERGQWEQNASKPRRPKEALLISLKNKRIPRSSSIYFEIAKKANLNLCHEPSFERLKNILKQWFPV
jgi:hypothetical protein